MPSSIDALKEAIEFERKALAQYNIAMENSVHEQTQSELKKYIADKEQKIDALSWMVMAESGTLEPTEEAPKNGAEKLAAGKCPFSGELAKMGIDITKMGKPF